MMRWTVRGALAAALLAAATFTACSDAGVAGPGEALTLSGDDHELASAEGALDPALPPGGECKTLETGGVCRPMSTWKDIAAKRCDSMGLALTEVHATSTCDSGRVGAIGFTCCKPDPDPCITITRGGPGSCKPESTWLAVAEKSCASKGMILSDFAVSGPCGKGRWSNAEFRCCPDAEVCCETADGPMITPAAKCPEGHALAPDACKPADVCCKLPDGTLATLPADQCKAKGGAAAPLDLCMQKVCCETADGYAFVSADACPAGAIVPIDLCTPHDVCCKLDGGYFTVPSTDCPAGQVVPSDLCKPQDVCCKLPDGTLAILTADECKLKGGAAGSVDLCDPKVCCETSAGYAIVPASQCPNAQVPMELCAPQEVCCIDAAGMTAVLAAAECKAKGGTVAPMEKCAPQKGCCLTPDGAVAILTADECKAKGGTQVSMEKCDPTICCETSSGYALLPSSQCPTGAIVPNELCKPELVCCVSADGTYQILPAAECPSSQVVPDEKCKPQEVCCLMADGTYAFTSSTQCPSSQVVPNEKCKPEEKVCCITADGTYAYVPASQCPAGAAVPAEKCDPSVCCETPAGYAIVPASQCPNAQVPFELCKPTEVCCMVGGAYMVVPSTQCPDGQLAPMDKCQYTPCDEAIFGQCKGYDYTAQCDPKGFDCGPLGILGDLDCDGKYEVCIACPPGTHPVDADGDGCEEMCDCCEPLLCPAGTEPMDTDGDGCPDTCKGALCDLAISGQCEGFDYTAQCNPTGFDCTSFAILGDKDCDGKYDVCIECPPGTVPMDHDGDGCEEVCDCPTDPAIP